MHPMLNTVEHKLAILLLDSNLGTARQETLTANSTVA